ncbi:MAG: hypothetical protein ACXVCV_21940 [Polyangia bacterium]
MSKRGGNHPVRSSKQALVREAARTKRRPARKGKAGAAPSVPAAGAMPRAQMPKSPKVLERAHDREFARMNERKPPPSRVKVAGSDEQQPPRYLSDAARGILRRVARYALTPVVLARAVVERFRSHD